MPPPNAPARTLYVCACICACAGAHNDIVEYCKEAQSIADEAARRAAVGARAEGWTATASALQAQVADATLFLPAFDLRNCQTVCGGWGGERVCVCVSVCLCVCVCSVSVSVCVCE
jgi:hypothetical protein